MAGLELLCHLICIDSKKFSKEEKFILDAELYLRLFKELWDFFYTQHRTYFQLLKLNYEMENIKMEINFIRYLINDILRSEAYTLSGIAYYTYTPEEVIQDLLIGYKVSPIISFPRKLIELHKAIRPEIYKNIIAKLTPDKED